MKLELLCVSSHLQTYLLFTQCLDQLRGLLIKGLPSLAALRSAGRWAGLRFAFCHSSEEEEEEGEMDSCCCLQIGRGKVWTRRTKVGMAATAASGAE